MMLLVQELLLQSRAFLEQRAVQCRLQRMPCAGGVLLSEKLEPRSGLPPLLTNLGDRPPESLHYLGTSFGLTQNLLNFWRKSGFAPVYLRQNASDITGAFPASCKKYRQFRWQVQTPKGASCGLCSALYLCTSCQWGQALASQCNVSSECPIQH